MKTKVKTEVMPPEVDVSDGGPGLGEVRLGEDLGGYRYAARRLDDGELSVGRVRRKNGAGVPAGDYPVLDECACGFRVDTNKGSGPAKVNSRAFQSGWENTYGRHGGKAS